MITVNVLYPNQDGAKFDMNYYLTSHIPMVKRVLGSALKGCVVEQGLGGAGQALPASILQCADVSAALIAVTNQDTRLRDWANLARYRDAGILP